MAFDGISPRAYQHPADRAATAALQKVPYLDEVGQMPIANATTIGTDRPMVVLNSELVRLLDDNGRRAVLAHESRRPWTTTRAGWASSGSRACCRT